MKNKKVPFEIMEEAEYLDNLSYDEFVNWVRAKNWTHHLHSCKIYKLLEKFPGDKKAYGRLAYLLQATLTFRIIIKNRLIGHINEN